MPAEVEIDKEKFSERTKLLLNSWKEGSDAWKGAECMAFAVGVTDHQYAYKKSSSLQLWLFGYEVPDTIMVFLPDELHILSMVKRLSYLKPLASTCEANVGVKMVFHEKTKHDDGTAVVTTLFNKIKDFEKIGVFAKESATGKICDIWKTTCSSIQDKTVDVGLGIAELLAVKAHAEIVNVKKAALLSTKVMKDFVVQKMEAILDDDKKVKHSKLATMVENVIKDPQKIGVKLRAENCNLAFPPIFQSGGNYSLKLTACSDDEPLRADTMVFSLGTRYSSYCAIISRCYVVDPVKEMEEVYAALLAAHEAAIAALVENAALKSARNAAVDKMNELEKPGLAEKLPKSLGNGMGTEIRDSSLTLTQGNERLVKAGMVFHVASGLSDLEWPTKNGVENEGKKVYAFLIADTVVVQDQGKPPEVLTASCPRSWNHVAYFLCDDQDEAPVQAQPEVHEEVQDVRGRHLRTEIPNYNNKEQQRKDIQNSLQEMKNQETLERLMAEKDGQNGTTSTSGRSGPGSDMVAYKTPSEVPAVGSLVITVDQRNECVLVPVLGVMVPFHVTTIKSIGSQVDGGNAYIRLNFNFGANYAPAMKFPKQIFLKELSFRSSHAKHAAKVVQEIKVLRSAVFQRNKERAERATLVTQEKLTKGKRVFRLPDLWIRPTLGGKGKKMSGSLEAHYNGFRYDARRSTILDIMYRNIRFAFFQPADNEMITVLHFHLINPIMVGKKKTKDVQFYAEVMDVVQTLDGSRRSAYDPDEIEEEQRERDRCNRINKEFENFVKRVQDHWEREFTDLRLEFDIPFRDLGFNGVPHKSNVFLMPTVNCLVELVEMPFTVIALEDIEIVNLERVGFNLRNFDLAIIFKDFNRDVQHIYTIPAQSLDTIKEWLTQVKIKYYETKTNLAWKNILKKIMEDPQSFINDGGWKFLDMDASDSDDEMSDENSEFQPESDELDESSDFESSDEASLVDSDSGANEEDSEDGEDEEGLTWDQLEEEAKRDDREKQYSDETDDEYSKRRDKRKMGPSVGGGGKRHRNY